jgi:hypothetical protein
MSKVEKCVYGDYPVDKAINLIGRTIKYHHGEWNVIDLVHDHFVLESVVNNYRDFVEPKYILAEIADQYEAEEFKNDNILQKVFDEKGIAKLNFTMSSDGDGYQYAFGGEMTTNLGRNAGSFNTILIFDSMNDVDGEIEFGYSGNHGSYYHTLKKDSKKPYGIHLEGGHEGVIDFDKFEWIPREDFKEYLLKEFNKGLKKNLKINDEVFFHENDKNTDESVNFTFWSKNSDVAYRVRGKYKDSKEKDYSKYLIDVGKIKDEPVAGKKSGKAQSGRSASWGYKFTLSKKSEIKTKKEIFKILNDLMSECVEEANQYVLNELSREKEVVAE